MGSVAESESNSPSKKLIYGLLLIVALAAIVFAIWQTRQQPLMEGLLVANGRLEGRITTITPKVAGRVVSLFADEGELTTEGKVLVQLEDSTLFDRAIGAREHLASLGHQLEAAAIGLQTLEAKVPLLIQQAEHSVEEGRAKVAAKRATWTQAKKDARRQIELQGRNLAAEQAVDAANLAAQTTEQALKEMEASLASADRALTLARLGSEDIKAGKAAYKALENQLRQAQATLSEHDHNIAELAISSPIAGTLLTRNIELGERVNPGTPLFTLVDLNALYLKIYIPEPELGKVTFGQPARVYVDAYKDRFFEAKVTKIAGQAEFTPKQVETREERVKLVFAVELAIAENTEGLLKPGMPADAVVKINDAVEWVRP
ncbi:MAG: efflux RND transporter periplasmic adaptor subunit [Gammaproteobacteria bacterium]|nr:efflux RND transporter periplasmic adaptor subunit [Gammaproteobacteria bacterium]MBQ0840341.1 efflux RND transporter periplasmic adaptor subunit [Gammaproteobacteria bacterium]